MNRQNSSEPPQHPAIDLRFIIRKLIRGAQTAALGTTLAGEARPYVSLVTVSSDFDGTPLLLLSRLADHTVNTDSDKRVSLLFDGTAGYANPQQGPRVTILGKIEHCNEPRSRARFLARNPGATLYADFADFAFYRVSLDRAHWVGGFARAVWLDDRLSCDHHLADAVAAAAPDLLARINDEHADDLTLLANRLLKRRGKGWRMVAVDPDGCDLAQGKRVLRLAFDMPLVEMNGVQAALTGLIERARDDS